MGDVNLTVVYDNYLTQAGLQTAHGFACVVRAEGRAVLFDAGGSGQILLGNMGKLGIDLAEVEAVVLSHMHWDHTGGLDAVLAAHPEVDVYAPAAFSSSFLQDVRTRARAVVETGQPHQVIDHVWTTDVLGGSIPEQALCAGTAEGTVVVTGCAHPGVVELARSAGRTLGGGVEAVLGGFHMAGMDRSGIERVIQGLRELDVRRVGPCHCSGDLARRAMREAFGDDYLGIGVGTKLTFPATGTGPNTPPQAGG